VLFPFQGRLCVWGGAGAGADAALWTLDPSGVCGGGGGKAKANKKKAKANATAPPFVMWEKSSPVPAGGSGGGQLVVVCLTGLVGAAHLNGREGALRGRDPNNAKRCTVRLEDGKDGSVCSQNYETVQRGPPLAPRDQPVWWVRGGGLHVFGGRSALTPGGCQIGYMCDQNPTYGLHSLTPGGCQVMWTVPAVPTVIISSIEPNRVLTHNNNVVKKKCQRQPCSAGRARARPRRGARRRRGRRRT
jgi:hypothetical protein